MVLPYGFLLFLGGEGRGVKPVKNLSFSGWREEQIATTKPGLKAWRYVRREVENGATSVCE
jgi:hypothetical protein